MNPLKPDDLVETPTGRMAKISEVNPGNRRTVVYLDDDGGSAVLPCSLLKLMLSAPVRPWKKHTLE